VYYSSLLVSVTESCTVGCRHCGYLGSARAKEATEDQVADWVTQALDYGIPYIIFTGGEPFQRFRLLKAGVHAANAHESHPGISSFTSSFWGKSPETVDGILDQLPGMTHLYLSTDVFHQEKVPPAYVMNVIDGAIRRGIEYITLVVTIAEDAEEEQFRTLYQGYGDRLVFHIERVIPSQFTKSSHPQQQLKPIAANFSADCFLKTPIINPDGDLAACHIAKVGAHQSLEDEVYFLGNLHQEPFSDIMKRSEENYEYQFLRAFGPQGVARLVQQSENLRSLFGDRTFTRGCDLCCRVLLNKKGKQALREWTGDSYNRELIDSVLTTRLGEDGRG
jgi:MoaA/NifB/PqqE/SkfB family radical SAM enzyme